MLTDTVETPETNKQPVVVVNKELDEERTRWGDTSERTRWGEVRERTRWGEVSERTRMGDEWKNSNGRSEQKELDGEKRTKELDGEKWTKELDGKESWTSKPKSLLVETHGVTLDTKTFAWRRKMGFAGILVLFTGKKFRNIFFPPTTQEWHPRGNKSRWRQTLTEGWPLLCSCCTGVDLFLLLLLSLVQLILWYCWYYLHCFCSAAGETPWCLAGDRSPHPSVVISF